MKAIKILLLVSAMLRWLTWRFPKLGTQTSAAVTNWYAVASSADGSRLIASGYRITGPVSVSTNAGHELDPNSVAVEQLEFGLRFGRWKQAGGSSIRGSDLHLDGRGHNLEVKCLANQLWGAIACSADGSNLVALVGGGTIAAQFIFRPMLVEPGLGPPMLPTRSGIRSPRPRTAVNWWQFNG